ncbi:uncharacterized protein LOC121999260 [Zingiber officinale]|uniref:uncharacterized protein LOC121999260 n=1 Tax=Zingiber officinale TaxID=94328 RepID=UPI001C4C766C|nr:uncharacterized protein LOC121999260 [Zingiber officinale]
MQAQGSSQLPSQTTSNPKGNVSTLTLRSGRRVSEFSSEGKAAENFPELQQSNSNSEGSEEIQEDQNVPNSSSILDLIDPLDLEHSQEGGSLMPEISSNSYPAEQFPAELPNSSKSGNQEFKILFKKKLKGNELISLGKNVSALIQPVPQKCEDPGVFTVPCEIGSSLFKDAMLDLGASINVMPRSVFQTLGIGPLLPTGVVIQLADHSQTHPAGVIEDVLVKVRELIFPADFYILDMEGDYLASRSPLILGRPFFKTARTKIDIHAGTLSMEIGDTVVQFSIFDAMKHPREDHSILSLDISEELDSMDFFPGFDSDFVVDDQSGVLSSILGDISVVGVDDEFCGLFPSKRDELCVGDCLGEALPLRSLREEDELKPLPPHLKYAYLRENQQLPVIIAQNLEPEQENRLLEILRQHRKAIGWTLSDIPGISPSICMHRIYLEEDVKPVRQPQRRLNPLVLDVVKKEVSRLLQASIIYPISDSKWVSPIHVVPKKSGVTVVANEENELVPIRVKNSWRVYIDYRKLNQASRKDHYPLPFIDQMLERLAGHIVSRRGIEVDPAKISVISSLSYPACVRDVRAFLGHAGFYRRFIRNFSKITLPLSQLLQKDVEFQFDQRCKEAFHRLKEALISAPIIRPPDWTLPFELMCDASNFAIGVVLAQRVEGAPHVIYYASKTLDSAQANYTTTEKELLSIVFAFHGSVPNGCEDQSTGRKSLAES